MKTFFGSTFINKQELEKENTNYPIKIEYYKIINEEDLNHKKGTKYGIQVIKTEYKENNEANMEEDSIRYLSNDEKKVNEILEILKSHKVTPISLQDIILDFSREILLL